MRKQWRIIGCLTGLVGLGWLGARAMGQDTFEVPQYPQYVQYPSSAPPVVPAVPGAQVTLTPAQIDSLLGLIALYPDPLLSLIFSAATYPQDVVAADQWLMGTHNPTEADIDAQSWDVSVKGLVHYPGVLNTMSAQIGWTQAVGAAFINQPKDVLASVQRLRAEAQAARNLQTTPQEQVIADNGAIRIEPVDPNVIYVPQYDPNLVYDRAYSVSFGIGYPIGLWCDNDFNWGGGYLVNGGGWYSGWHHPAEWDRNRPGWDRRPPGWVAAPKPWVRAGTRPAPRITSAGVVRLGLDRPHGATGVTLAAGAARQGPARPQIGGQPTPPSSKNIFGAAESRTEAERALQRARPTPARPVPVLPPQAPRPVAASPAQRSAAPERVAPAPAPPRAAPSNVFRGGSAGATRAQSSRGNASQHR